MLISLLSCKKEHLTAKPIVVSDPTLASELKSSNEEIVIDNITYKLETYVYRDFMPGANTNGSGLICSIKLKNTNNTQIRSDVNLKKLYILNDIAIWITNFDEIRMDNKQFIEGMVSKGPKWETKTIIDIACEFQIGLKTHRVLAKSQLIKATY